MITRVRLEASAPTEEAVQDDLLGTFAIIKEALPGTSWREEPPGMDIQSTKNGHWGRLTVVRIGAQGGRDEASVRADCATDPAQAFGFRVVPMNIVPESSRPSGGGDIPPPTKVVHIWDTDDH